MTGESPFNVQSGACGPGHITGPLTRINKRQHYDYARGTRQSSSDSMPSGTHVHTIFRYVNDTSSMCP